MTGIQKTWKRVCQDAGLAKMRLHDLRHSFASFAIANGENIVLIAAALGHASTRMTERYLHLRDHDVSALAERTGQRILSCASKTTSSRLPVKFPDTAQTIP
jgi:integrase